MALAGAPKTAPAPTTHTLAWAIDRYRNSSAWARLSVATRRQTENIFKHVIRTAGTIAPRDITAETIKKGREKRKEKPHAANNFLKSMRRLFKWAADPDGGNLIAANPTVGVKLLKGSNSDGFHTWTEEEIKRFEDYWPIGRRERLALDLLQFTSFDRGDVVRLGRQHVKNGQIEFRMAKARGVGMVYPPMLPILAATISASKAGDLTYLVTENGTPFVKESFGNWFREAARAAGCPGSAHGLRKFAATRCAENGATVPQLMAMFGWSLRRWRCSTPRRRAARSSPPTQPRCCFRHRLRTRKSRTFHPVRKKIQKKLQNQVLRKHMVPRRVVPDGIVDAEPHEPAEQQVVVELLHQLALGADRVEGLDQRAAQQLLGRDRGPAHARVELGEPWRELLQHRVDQRPHYPQRMIGRDALLHGNVAPHRALLLQIVTAHAHLRRSCHAHRSRTLMLARDLKSGFSAAC